MNYDVIFLEQSLTDFWKISLYMSEFDSNLAVLFVDRLSNKLQEELSMFPYMYREYFKWVRFIPFKWYVVFYRIIDEKKKVEILSIVHGATDLNDIKF